MRPQNIPDHYEQQCCDWQNRFLTLDQDQLLKKLPCLKIEDDYLTLSYFQKKHGIHRGTGKIVCFGYDKPLTLFTRLNIYTLLWYCTESAAFKGEWLPFRSLKDASPFGPAFQKTVVDVFARTFSGHSGELEAAFQKMGGKKLPHSDVGYQLNAFECIPVQFLFWDGDDEFPAQANILFDRGSTDYIHVESLVSIASEGLSFLTEVSGVALTGNTFA